MENVTHTLIGVAFGELVFQARARRAGADSERAPSEAFRGAAWLASALANNLPDADFLYVPITGGKLGYLLHHRGHTHTLGLAPLLALVSWAIVVYAWKRRKLALTRTDGAWLAMLALSGIGLHVGMDSLNDYGVHPFWPLSAQWFHGDTIFIAEPLFWIALAGPLIQSASSRAGKLALSAPLALAVLLPFVVPALPWSIHLMVALLALAIPALGWRMSQGARPAFAFALTLLVIAVFSTGRALAEANTRAALAAHFPRMRVGVLALQPSPSDPRCFRGLAVGIEDTPERTYVVRRFVAVAASWWGAPADCQMQQPFGLTVPMHAPDPVDTDSVHFVDAFAMPMTQLESFAADCRGDAFLRYARVPYLADHEGTPVAGDMRYDREPRLGFAEIELPQGETCPAFVPPWGRPIEPVLDL